MKGPKHWWNSLFPGGGGVGGWQSLLNLNVQQNLQISDHPKFIKLPTPLINSLYLQSLWEDSTAHRCSKHKAKMIKVNFLTWYLDFQIYKEHTLMYATYQQPTKNTWIGEAVQGNLYTMIKERSANVTVKFTIWKLNAQV